MFWTNFEKLCTEIGKSPNAVATELCIPSGSITAWSKGTKPRNQTIKKIADYFDVTVQSLLCEQPTVSDGLPKSVIDLLGVVATLSEEEASSLLAFLKANRKSK